MPMKPQVVAHELGRRLSPTAIVSCDSGTVATWWARHIPARRGQQYSLSGTLASMANGLEVRPPLLDHELLELAARIPSRWKIRKGEKSSPVIFWNIGDERETTTQDGTKETSRPFLLRYYSVFNLSQAEAIDIPASLLQETRINNPIETCEQLVTNMPNAPAFEQSDKAWYSPSNDVVGMPARGLFHSSEEYYATEFHELAHSTGHAKRLHRENFDNPVSFGSESYSKEELIAEMTAAMLCGIAGIEQRILENSAAYLMTWIARLKSDSRLLVSAASQAQKAADFIQGKAPHQLAEA